MIARTVVILESADGSSVSRWSFLYEDIDGHNGSEQFAMAQCIFFANTEIAAHVMCVAVVNSLTAIARWGGK